MAFGWYAIQTDPQRELDLWRDLDALGVESYFPALPPKINDSNKGVVRPYLPGLVFVRIDPDRIDINTLEYIPHSQGIVRAEGLAARIPSDFIFALKRRMVELERTGSALPEGRDQADPTWLADAPFEGYRAIFNSELSGDQRVVALVKMLSEQRTTFGPRRAADDDPSRAATQRPPDSH